MSVAENEDVTVSNSGTWAVRFVSRVSSSVRRVLRENVVAVVSFVWPWPFGDDKDAEALPCKGTTLLKVMFRFRSILCGLFHIFPQRVVPPKVTFPPSYMARLHFSTWASFPQSWTKQPSSLSSVRNTCSLWQMLMQLAQLGWCFTGDVRIIKGENDASNGEHKWYHTEKSITLKV